MRHNAIAAAREFNPPFYARNRPVLHDRIARMEQLFRRKFGRAGAVLARSLGVRRLEFIEDAAQASDVRRCGDGFAQHHYGATARSFRSAVWIAASNGGEDEEGGLQASTTALVVCAWEPYGLIAGGTPANEFDSEIAGVVAQIPRIKTEKDAVLALSRVFSSAFEAVRFTPEVRMEAGTNLFAARWLRRRYPANTRPS